MNRHLHRIVFNAARGMRMVVQETATSTGKGASKATSTAGARAFIGAALAGMVVGAAHAQIVGAPNVPGSLRPTVLVAPNGVPLINIQTPSAAGVSRNIYNQFNVGPNGVIFNNSRTNVQTQLGGIVQGNPFLATGPARIILTEVNGGNVSQLRGYMEVAGQRAEIIIANPAGINVDGAGFINASRATLTTGTPQLNALGGLDSFLVRGGTVTINGAGLDASKTDYAAILARAVEANAGIWASELKVVTGANRVSADHSQISPTTGTGAAPTFALDVAALGGMYAGKIVLVGTEAGLGVRNAGTIQAAPGTPALAGAGQLVVTSAGRLENIGTIQATADANLAASNLANSGRISSGGNLKIATQETLGNSFNGAGGTLEGARVELASAAGNIDNRNGGTIRQTSSAALAISAPALSNSGGVIGLEPVPETPSQPGGGANPGAGVGTDTGGGTATPSAPAAGGGTSSGGTITPAPYVPPSPGAITAAGAILNDGGRIYAGGPITLQSANINNNGGTMSLASMTVAQPAFDNRDGTLNISNGFSANVGSFDNTSGKLNAGTLAIASSGDLVNTDGTLSSAGDASLTVGGKADNTRGTISAMGALNAKVAGATNNTAGTLVSNQGLTLNTGSLDNTKGSIQSAQAGAQLMVTNQLVNGSGGAIGAATDLNVQAGELTNGGSLRGANDVSVAVGGALTNDSSITAGRNTTLTAGSLQSSSTGVLGAGVQNDGKLGSAGDLRVTIIGALVANGNNIAAGNATLQGASVDLSASETNAANIAITATQGNVVTGSVAKVITPGTLSVTANGQGGQTLVNDAGTLNAGQLDLNASNIVNTNGGEIVQTGTGASTIATSGTLNNDGGRIASNGQDLSLRGAVITNTGGRIEHAGAGTLGIAGGSYNATNGQITTNKTLTVALSGAFSQDGAKARVSADRITLDAGALANRGGQIVQTGADATRITVVGAIDNTAGTLASNGNTNIAAGSLTNQGGNIRSAGASNLDLAVAEALDNSNKGVIGAGGSITLTARNLNNNLGSITAVGNLEANVLEAATNVGGTLAANGNTTLVTGTLDNSSGTTAAVKGDLSVKTSGTTTNNEGTLQAGAKATLSSGGLINTAGKVFGDSLSVDTGGNELDNSKKGTLAATTTVDVKSGALNNDTGLIQSGGAMTIDTGGKKLTNTNAAGYTNKQGGITSADTLTLRNVGDVDNAAGFIGSKNALDAKTQAFSNTGGGTVLGQSTVVVNTNGAGYDNTGGQTMAVGDLTVDAGSVTNAGGLIRSMATTTLKADAIANANTRGVEQGIEGKNVSIAARSIGNNTGAIRADENVTLSSSGTLDNSAGLVSAGAMLTVKDPGAPKALSVFNTGGTLIAGKKVVLDAGSVTWDGKLLSLGDMDLAVTKDITFAVGSETVANNNLTVSTTGDITNNGKLAAGKDLTLTANDINNTATGDIQGKTTTLNASGTLTNRGVIDGGATRINAGVLNNYGTGRIYGDWVSISVGTLNNDVDPATGAASAGTIAARSRLDIGADTVNNRNGALIFSDGDLFISGKLVEGKANDALSTKAGSVNNHAATIEATQNVGIKTSVLNNTNGGVTWTTQTQSDGKQHTEFALPGSTTRYDPSQLVFVSINGAASSPVMAQINGVLWPDFVSHPGPVTGQFSGILVPSASYPLSRYKAYYTNPPRNSSTLAGSRPVGIDGSESFTEPGAWYSRTDPIWATFGVVPPATDTPDDAQRAAYLEAHKRLDTATAAFIADVYANYARSYYYWNYTESTTTPVLQTSAPGRIIAGGKMDIVVGSGTNEMSQILAGGALNVTGGTIDNKNVEVSGAQTRNGVQVFQAGGGAGEQISPYNTSVPVTVTLAAARQEGNVAVIGSGTSTGTLSLGHTGQGVASASGVNGSNPTGVGGGTGTSVNAPGAGSGGTTSPVVSPIVQVRLAASSGTEQVVRTTLPGLRLPAASLFRSHPEASSQYLIETDPRFAGYRNWLSSDYLLNNLGQDPNNTLKRLGDGFYEQRLVREQVAQLTGYRYLDGYDSDDKQYAALMDAGVTFAKQYGLRPGIALSDAQMAQLTSDIVWLVEQTVTLPDGSTQRVLVPQVYVRVKNGDIDGSGALLAGKEVNIKLDGDLVNSGTVAGRETVKISAQNIQNLNGRISGGSLDLKARTDLNNIGGTIDAANELKIDAGRDINVRTTTSSSGLALDISPGAAVSLRGATIVDRVAGLYVSDPKGVLVASAGRDVNLIGAIVSNSGKEGTTEIGAGRDINLGTVTTARQDASWRDTRNFRAEASTEEVGTRIETSGDISLHAKRDVNVRAGTINSADGALEVVAKRDINIVEGRSGSALNEMRYESDSSFLGSDTSLQRGTSSGTQVIGSSLGGKTVILDATRDLRIRGSNVVSDKGTELWAGNNITIEAATQNKASDFTREESKSGMFDATSGWTWGQQRSSSSGSREQGVAVGSTVGAIDGNVIITAGSQYRQVGSDVIAPGGDIGIRARSVQIVEARETSRSDSKQSFSQSGITLGMKAPLIDTLRNLEDTSQAVRNTKSDRMQALGAASMGLTGYSTYQDISQAAATNSGGGAVGMGATLTLGSSSSESTRTQSSDTSAGSRVQAGGNVYITAAGGGQDSNILVRGSDINAGKNVSLSADNSVTLEAAANTQKQSSTSRSSNSSIGVGVSFGETTGITLEVAAGTGRGSSSGSDGQWSPTTITAGKQLTIKSGGDTTLRGASASGERVDVDVGGNLRIETLQDTSTSRSQSSGSSFSGSFCIYMCYGGSVSASSGSTRGEGNYASATQQSGLFAGGGGFGVKVAGNTTLVGGAIASTDTAVNGGKNSFETSSLTLVDLVNHDTFTGSGHNVSVSTSWSESGSSPGGGAGIGSKNVNQASVTQSGISGIAGNTNVRTGVNSTNALRQTDFDRAMRDVGAQVYLTAQFGSQAARAAGSYADRKFQEAVDNKDVEGQRLWGADGGYRVALHAGIGALTGGASGAAGAAAASLSLTDIGARIYGLGLPDAVAQGLTQAVALAIGGAVGGTGGAAGAFNEASNNNLTLLMNLGQAAARFGQVGWSGLAAGTQALLIRCAQNQGCAALLTSSMLVAINTAQTQVPEPTGAGAIPVGPRDPLPPPDPMVNVPIRPDQAGGTSTSGDVLPGQGSPGYEGANPTTGNNSTTSPMQGPLGPNVMVSQDVGNGVKLYPDGSLRTPDGKFASISGAPAPGTAAAAQFADLLRQNGVNVVGLEMEVDGPLGKRRYDIVTQDSSGVLHGIEIKTGGATQNSYQDFTDRYINRFGADGTGRLAGKRIVSSTTVYLP